jgi:hydroxymethylpyrimidine kinase/phosphomethylpyrimidine kinase
VANRESSLPNLPELIIVGGLDPGGGAGLVRDWLTATERGARPTLIGSAWTDQGPGGVAAVEPRDRRGLVSALDRALAAASGMVAVKVGMIATPDLARAVAEVMEASALPLVFDPVLGASAGGSLFEGSLIGLDPLLRRADLVTPNAAEATALAGVTVEEVDDARRAATILRARGARAVLVKGGHLRGDAVDLLLTAEGETLFRAPRVPGPGLRGTGCALATAIAVELARGGDLAAAVGTAKAWLLGKLRAAA